MGMHTKTPHSVAPNRRVLIALPPPCCRSRRQTFRLTAEQDWSTGRPRGVDRLNGGVQVKLPHVLQPQPGVGRSFERPLHELSTLRDRPRRRPPREGESPAPRVAKYLPRHRQAFFRAGFRRSSGMGVAGDAGGDWGDTSAGFSRQSLSLPGS